VRFPAQLKEAVAKTIAEFGRIDYVICGKFLGDPWDVFHIFIIFLNIGAAGNFLVPISGMSENAFKTVMEIDTVCSVLHSRCSGPFISSIDWFF
jgi:peroxisomal 2,4-dienoyl-CoA reductase